MSVANWITEVRFYSTEKSGNGPAARGTITVADSCYINFVIWENDGSLQLTMPRTENRNFDPSKPPSKENKKYFDEVGFTDKDTRIAVTNYVLAKLEQERGASSRNNFADVPF